MKKNNCDLLELAKGIALSAGKMVSKGQYRNKKFAFDHSQKTYDYLYLNKMEREHSQKLFHKISQKKLLDTSLNTNWPDKKLTREYELPWLQQYPQY